MFERGELQASNQRAKVHQGLHREIRRRHEAVHLCAQLVRGTVGKSSIHREASEEQGQDRCLCVCVCVRARRGRVCKGEWRAALQCTYLAGQHYVSTCYTDRIFSS